MRENIRNTKKYILRAMFDLRHLDKAGNLDMEKINQISAVLDLRGRAIKEESEENYSLSVSREQFSSDFQKELPTREEILSELAKINQEEQELLESILKEEDKPIFSFPPSSGDWLLQLSAPEPYFAKVAADSVFDLSLISKKSPPLEKKNFLTRGLIGFLTISFLFALVVPGLGWFDKNLSRQDKIKASSLAAYQNLLSVKQSLEETNWPDVEKNFSLAHHNFFEANEEIKKLGRLTINILGQLPGGSLVASGAHLVKAGENLSLAGQYLTAAINLFASEDFFSLFDKENNRSLSDLIALSREKQNEARQVLSLANQELNRVEIESLPIDFQDKVFSLKEKLPSVQKLLIQSLDYSAGLLDILGHDNERQYLLLFQNNSEIRATGGFIGTYGLLTLDRGRVKKIFIDGVFNADGQLREKIIPPRPIQKISTAWSMHDANWFFDFPTSAKKAAWFYEKTGGPTVDGVIALTPAVVERLLKLTGSMAMPEYGIILTPENFVELVQQKVEIDYDKELNQPKKILTDFAPKFIEALTQLPPEKKKEAINIIFGALNEKHILIYFNQNNLEDLIKEQGWGGTVLETEKDYLSVVSSNINGFKTDRVIKEEISHQAEIQTDGSIIDILTIIRQHQGGDLAYDWWNKVNANYLRVYLPLGSELLSAEGQTLEVYLPPLDYAKYGFKGDSLVKEIEDEMIIDRKTGTQIFKESGKTVFGNWVYVSPGETVKLIYRYKLPFKIDLNRPADSYSLLVQKQAGSLGSQFIHSLKFPRDWRTIWQYPENQKLNNGFFEWSAGLETDKFFGLTFEF